jgi:hypothetical protein
MRSNDVSEPVVSPLRHGLGQAAEVLGFKSG